MRRLFSPFLLGLSVFASAQFELPVAKPMRTLNEVMVDDLADPRVQVALGVTPTQLQLQNARLSSEAMKLAFAMLRSSVAEEGSASGPSLNMSFTVSASGALFPYLTEAQLAKLRRLAVKHQPLNALGTNEVAYALELTAAQRARIDALRAEYWKRCLSPDRPAVKTLKGAIARLSTAMAKLDAADKNSTEGVTTEKLDAIQPMIMDLFAAFEKSIRLSAGENSPAAPDPLKLLTSAQRHRYRELSGA